MADLSDTTWRLVDLGYGQAPVLSATEISLAITDGQVSGSGGCNDYGAALSEAEDLLQSFVVGPIAASEMGCPDAVSAQATIYLALLESVLGWRYDAGRLALAYPASDGVYDYLRFAPGRNDGLRHRKRVLATLGMTTGVLATRDPNISICSARD